MSDTANVKLGVCQVSYDGVDLGYTKGGVEVEVSTDTYKSTVDQFGQTEINEYITKRTVKVKAPLAETTLENMVAIMPGATLVTDGLDPTKKRVDVTTGIGTNLLSMAKELKLTPIGATDSNDDFIIPLAATSGSLQFAYKFDQERVFNCEFVGYPNPTSKVLFQVGDETAVA
jgi:hypothetical protein